MFLQKSIFGLLVYFFVMIPINAQTIQEIKNGPFHEAFLTKECGTVILQATASEPPSPIQEKIPPQTDAQTQWIPGYWSTTGGQEEFVWIPGIWRRPPPGFIWVTGEWKSFEEGWVRIEGFWSIVTEQAFQYISQPPPDPIDEKILKSPGDNYFWMQGYWVWDSASEQYVWYSGRWEKFDPHWVYTPARYMWQKSGYVYIPGFWDWPLEKRGTAYSSLLIPLEEREKKIDIQARILHPYAIIEAAYPVWPNYASFFHFHYFFHQKEWNSWDVAAPWWNGNTWWGLTHYDQWGLWWWWTHPDYPPPSWMTADLAATFSPPSEVVLDLMKAQVPPTIVTSTGVITSATLLKALQRITGMPDGPIIPNDPQEIEAIEDAAKPKQSQPVLLPSGQPNSGIPEKPFLGPHTDSLKAPPSRVRTPPKPVTAPPPLKTPEKLPVEQPPRELPAMQYKKPTPTLDYRYYREPHPSEYQSSPRVYKRITPREPARRSFQTISCLSNDNKELAMLAQIQPAAPQNSFPVETPPVQTPPTVVTPPTVETPPIEIPPLPPAPPERLPQKIPKEPTKVQKPNPLPPSPYPVPPPQIRAQPPPSSRYRPNTVRPHYKSVHPHFQGSRPVNNWPPVSIQIQENGNFMNRTQPQRNPPVPSIRHEEEKWEKYEHRRR